MVYNLKKIIIVVIIIRIVPNYKLPLRTPTVFLNTKIFGTQVKLETSSGLHTVKTPAFHFRYIRNSNQFRYVTLHLVSYCSTCAWDSLGNGSDAECDMGIMGMGMYIKA